MKKMMVGGQAVIEGVMMRSPKKTSTVVRSPSGKLVAKTEKTTSIGDNIKILRWPFVRGLVVLIDMLVIGMKALNFSAEVSLEDEDKKDKGSPLGFWGVVFSILFALIFALILFKLIPLSITQFAYNKWGILNHSIAFNIVEGLLKVMIFLLYIYLISFMGDIKRVFMYHGAEHKAVYCYESGKPLTVENARKFSTLHPRCGTSFIIFVLLLSIVVYSFLPNDISFWWKLGYRLLLLPLIISVSYEIIRYAGGRGCDNKLVKALVYPGLLSQKLTTRRPTDDQIRVALTALKKTL